MSFPISKNVDPEKLFSVQDSQNREVVLLTDTVPAGQTKQGQVSISSAGPFHSLYMTGGFETLSSVVGVITDTGVNYLSGQLIDSTGNRQLFNRKIPLNLFLSPGRQKSANSAAVATDPPGNALFYPVPFEYTWRANSLILLDVVNTSNTPLSYWVAFHGVRFTHKLK